MSVDMAHTVIETRCVECGIVESCSCEFESPESLWVNHQRIVHPEVTPLVDFITDSWAKTQLRFCYTEALSSPDLSTQNGARVYHVESDARFTLVGQGVNDLTPGVEVTPERLERPLKYAYTEHAERSAIFDAFKSGRTPDVMVAVWASCADCARAIVLSGIKVLVRHVHTGGDGRWRESIDHGDVILKAGGVDIVEVAGPIRYCDPVLFDGEQFIP